MPNYEIGGIRASLSASSAAFAKDMQAARNAVKSNAKGMERAMIGVRDSFNAALKVTKTLAIAAAGGATALAVMVRGAINNADSMQKMAQSVGTNVENLTGMKHAAELAGLSFENMATGFKMVAKNALDAAAGTGLAKDAFNALKIDVLKADGT